jgi:hypothetical protein
MARATRRKAGCHCGDASRTDAGSIQRLVFPGDPPDLAALAASVVARPKSADPFSDRPAVPANLPSSRPRSRQASEDRTHGPAATGDVSCRYGAAACRHLRSRPRPGGGPAGRRPRRPWPKRQLDAGHADLPIPGPARRHHERQSGRPGHPARRRHRATLPSMGAVQIFDPDTRMWHRAGEVGLDESRCHPPGRRQGSRNQLPAARDLRPADRRRGVSIETKDATDSGGSAARLADGRALVAGGYALLSNGGGLAPIGEALSFAHRYDP